MAQVPGEAHPYGIQKRVELGRALAMEPELLLLDEPVAGMNLEETEDMARFILDIQDELGLTMILVEHDMSLVMDIADRVMVLDFGRRIAEGRAREGAEGSGGDPRVPGPILLRRTLLIVPATCPRPGIPMGSWRSGSGW